MRVQDPVGIDTDPESALHASGAGVANVVHTVVLANNPIPFGGNGNFGAAIAFSNSEGGGSLSKVMARVGGRNSVVGTSNGGDLVFETRIGATVSEKAVIKDNGNFGVGVVAPHSKLHVNGAQAGSTTVITGNTTLNLTHHKVVVNNGATNITITFPDPLTCIGREYIISRYNGSTGTISLNSIGVTNIQTLTGTIVGVGSIAAHSATGGGLNHSFTAVNVGGVGVWVRI
jgi:hypothetical protein